MSNNFAERVLRVTLNLLIFLFVVCIPICSFQGISYIFEGDLNFKVLIFGIFKAILGVSYLIITILLLSILNSSRGSVFINKNVYRFRNIGYILFIIFIVGYILTLAEGGPTGMRIIDLFPGVFLTFPMAIDLVVALMCFVIADIFRKAIKIKEDNDLTI